MAAQDLVVSLIQTKLAWEDPEENRRLFAEKIAGIQQRTDLIILPEMFTTGFSMQTEKLAETMEGPSVKWMQEMAALKNSAVCGSIIVKEAGLYFNRLLFAAPDGTVQTYDKRHLFRMAGENGSFSAGKSKLIVEWRGWKICPLVCYDLRFPVFSRWTSREPYDLLLYVANWPEKRSQAWKTLLAARAIENLSYCIGVNRVGLDANQIPYSGDSAICEPQDHTFFLPLKMPMHLTCNKNAVLFVGKTAVFTQSKIPVLYKTSEAANHIETIKEAYRHYKGTPNLQ